MDVWARVLMFLSLWLVAGARAELAPLADDYLSEVTGQALYKIEDFKGYPQTAGGSLDFMRLTIGAKIEINLNAQHVWLGTYPRATGTNCGGDRGGSRVSEHCYSSTGWNCTTDPCGYSNTSGIPNLPDTDIVINDLSLGEVVNGVLQDFVYENPYIEFAFSGSGANRKLVGVRQGFMSMNGKMGNTIEVISGAIGPFVEGMGSSFRTFFYGVRSRGYLYRYFEPGLVDFSFITNAAGPQLRNTRTINIVDGNDFFMSIQNRKVDYPALKAGVGAAPTTMPGFWINMMDGVNAKVELGTAQGPLPNNRM